jgi:hypothetical protein
VSLAPSPLIAFHVENEKATAAVELNSVEGKTGTGDKSIIEVQRGALLPTEPPKKVEDGAPRADAKK